MRRSNAASTSPSSRAIFRGTLRVGDERVGVKLYSAATDKRVHFHLLHEPDQVRVRQRMVHPTTDETVPPEEMLKGVEVERGVFVLLSDDELAKAEPAPSRDIELDRFVAEGALDHRWYERPYWLGPDNAQVQRYFALAEALEKSGRTGIARWTMRAREYVGALRLEGQHLALIALRYAEELLPIEDLVASEGRGLEERELTLARQLVSALAGPFDPAEFRDEYRERVLKYVEEKRLGGGIKPRHFKPRIVRDDALVAALERSIRKAG